MFDLGLVTHVPASSMLSPSGCAVPRTNTECVQKLPREKTDRMQCSGQCLGHEVHFSESWLTPRAAL
jgi:hypothetical protein